jgi:hypothetical protein
MDAGMDVRDLARIRTQARVVELAIGGLLAEVLDAADERLPPNKGAAGEAWVALRTAQEYAGRCQVALTAAMEKLPGYRAGGE